MTQQLAIDVELARGNKFRLVVQESIRLSGIAAIFGANGSGKTSLLRAIAGLEREATGSIQFGDTQWQGADSFVAPENRGIGYVFQEGRLFPHLTVRRNLLFAKAAGKRTPSIDFDSIAKQYRLEFLLDRYPSELSGGERQRVAVARALLSDPQLLLMDEPLSAIDHQSKRELLPLIKALPGQHGVPIIYVTHDIDELVYLADEVLLLADGERVARGSAREVFELQDFERLSALDSPGVVLEARLGQQLDGLSMLEIANSTLRIPRVDANPGELIRLRVHPRDVILATEPVTGTSIRNCLPATVISVADKAKHQVLVGLTVGDQLLKARVTADAAQELKLSPGQNVYALIKTVALDALG